MIAYITCYVILKNMGRSIFPLRLQFQSRKKGRRNTFFKQFLLKYFHLISMNWIDALEGFI